MKINRSASVYFALQSIAVAAWWILLFFVPTLRVHFQMGDSETILLAFWLPDLFLLILGSLAASVFCFLVIKFASIAAWFVVGAISYAALYCLAFALLSDSGWLGVTLMFSAMIWSGNFAIALTPSAENLMFRRANNAKTGWILTKTFAQIIIVWSLILFVFPS